MVPKKIAFMSVAKKGRRWWNPLTTEEIDLDAKRVSKFGYSGVLSKNLKGRADFSP